MNKTISVVVSNALGYSANYQMLVEFKCNKAVNRTTNFSTIALINKTRSQSKWPTAFISGISLSGLIDISFPQLMKVPEQPSEI